MRPQRNIVVPPLSYCTRWIPVSYVGMGFVPNKAPWRIWPFGIYAKKSRRPLPSEMITYLDAKSAKSIHISGNNQKTACSVLHILPPPCPRLIPVQRCGEVALKIGD